MTDTLAALLLAVALVAPPQVMTPPMIEAQAAHDAQLRLDELAALQCGPEGTPHECLPDPPAAAPRRHPPAEPAPVSPPPVGTVGRVEQWRGLVAAYFPAEWVEWALRIMQCESGGNPNAYNPSGASGLFQHLQRYWADRSYRAGWGGADIFDPEANIAVAAWLLANGGTSHWVCKASK